MPIFWLVIVWGVTYFIIYLRTLARRKGAAYLRVEPGYYMAFILVVAILHIVNKPRASPVSIGHAKRLFGIFPVCAGCDDAVVVTGITQVAFLPDRPASSA